MSEARSIQEETALITRIQRDGDRDAIAELLEPYRALMHHLARRLCVPDHLMPEEELVQAGYVGLMQAARRFDTGKSVRFITYAVPWALGEMKSALRSAAGLQRMGMLSLDDQGEDDDSRPMEETLAGGGINESAVGLHLALERLSQEERRLITVRYFEDRTQKEAASLLGRSQAQVSRMENRALDRLRDLLS